MTDLPDRSAVPPPPEIARAMDALPLTWLHVGAAAACGLGFAFDLLEIALGSVLAALFSTAGGTGPVVPLAWLLSSVYVGAMVGAPLLGALADRRGRRLALELALATLCVTSLLAAVSPDAFWLTIARLLSGLALGAYPPLMFAYLADIMPARYRGPVAFVTVAFASFGAPAGIFFVRWLTPIAPLGIDGWRWAFIFGGAGAALVALLLRRIPESPRWLAAMGHTVRADAARSRFQQSRMVRPSRMPDPSAPGNQTAPEPVAAPMVRLCFLYFLSPWSTVAFSLLIGAVLMDKGFRLTDTLLYVGASAFGPCIGSLLAASVIDRFHRRTTLAAAALAMMALGLVFTYSATPSVLVASSIGFTLVASIFLPALSLYGVEIVPGPRRASFSAGAWACNRAGAAMAPILLLPLLKNLGPAGMYSVIGASLALSVVLLAFLPRGEAARPVA